MIIAQLGKFKQICDELEIDFKKKDTFTQRIFIQKFFYFLSKLGLDLKSKYEFFSHGPYSSQISDMYDTLLRISEKDLELLPNGVISEPENTRVQKTKILIERWGNDMKSLELYSSILYINNDMYIKDKNKKEIMKIMKSLKPNLYTDKTFEKAYNELVTEGLINK